MIFYENMSMSFDIQLTKACAYSLNIQTNILCCKNSCLARRPIYNQHTKTYIKKRVSTSNYISNKHQTQNKKKTPSIFTASIVICTRGREKQSAQHNNTKKETFEIVQK